MVINRKNPADCITNSAFSFNGFLRIASINNINILPPSKGGNGKRLVTPSDNDINARIYTYSYAPFVSATKLEIPTGPIS